MNVLIVKLGSIGDIVHTLPALAALRRLYPSATIDWLVETRSREILLENPMIDALLEVDTLQWRRRLFHAATWRDVLHRVKALRARRYDLIFDFQGLIKSGMCALLARGDRRIGFARGHLRESAARFSTSERVTPPPNDRHVIDRNLSLLSVVGTFAREREFPIAVSPQWERRAEELLASWGVTEYVALNPGGGWETKRWAPARLGALARELGEDLGFTCLVLWGPGEKSMAEEVVASSSGAARLAPPTELREMIPFLKRARLFVGGDSGPLHIAAALGVPVVGIYGPTDALRNGPFAPEDQVVMKSVPCGPCYKRRCPGFGNVCLTAIEVEDVSRAVRRRLRAAE